MKNQVPLLFMPGDYDYFWDYCMDQNVIGMWTGNFDFIHINLKHLGN